MNKEEFQKNRQIIRMMFTDMFNQMNNMYDQLAVADKRIENARKEGYSDGVAENLSDCFDNYLTCDPSYLSESGLAMRQKFEDAIKMVTTEHNKTGRYVTCVMCPKCKYFSEYTSIAYPTSEVSSTAATVKIEYLCAKGHTPFPTIGCSDGKEKEE